MEKTHKIFFVLLDAILISFALTGFVLAQTESLSPSPTPTIETTNEIATPDEQEDVSAASLDVKEPTLLPDSKFYFLKEWQRNLRLAFAFNRIKKAEVRQEIVNEKLIELKALAAKTQDPKILEKAAANSQKHIEKLKEQIEKFKDNAQADPEVNKFLDKFVQQGLLQQRVLEQLEVKVPPSIIQKIEVVRERHLEMFCGVMSKLEDKNKIAARINNALENQIGDDFKQLKDVQTLRSIEEKLPTEIQDSIRQLQERNLNMFMENLEKMTTEKQEKIGDYLQKMGGDKEKQLEILETLKQQVKSEAIQNKLEQAKDKIIQKIEQTPQNENCPSWAAPAHGFCQDGRIVIDKEIKTGCRLPAKCVHVSDQTPCKPICSKTGTGSEGWYNSCTNELINKSECKVCKAVCGEIGTRSEGWYNSCNGELIKWDNCARKVPTKPIGVCITLWNPVCGSDNKTYSNDCFARAAGVSVIHKGVCKEMPEKPPVPFTSPSPLQPSCKNIWAYDNDHRFCQQKKYCGAYMYLGLHTFGTKEECEKSLKENNDSSENLTYCQKDEDCVCGVEKKTRKCSFGNVKYIDKSIRCPDFCTGITGKLKIICVSNICQQTE